MKNALWFGDKRIHDIKLNHSPIITKNNIANNQEAIDYYSKFSLGTYANKSSLDSLISKDNKYKIYAIVEYWTERFGLDKYLVYAMIMAESSGNPYCKTKSSAGGYGIMQCERGAYFNKKQTIKLLDDSTITFTPSYSTMTPYENGNTVLNGTTVDKNISNQIMFGCNELRKSLERFKYNIFASLVGYNFGLYGADWVICKYVADKNNLAFVDKFGYTAQSKQVQALYFKELATFQAEWSDLRQYYVKVKRMGTATNIEYYLRWYRSVDGQLPYTIDKDGNKRGYGVDISNSIEIPTITFKGCPICSPSDYLKNNELVETVVINGVEDGQQYPAKVDYIFLHFGIGNLSTSEIDDYKILINALLNKYSKTPIFISKEYYVNVNYLIDYQVEYTNINKQIDNFNKQMMEFAKKTNYVTMIDIPSKLVEGDMIITELSEDGYSMKDDLSCDLYYQEYCSAINNILSKEENSQSLIIESIIMKYGESYCFDKVDKISFLLKKEVQENFYSSLIFTTTEDTLIKQSIMLYLKGDSCENGKLIAKNNTSYSILVCSSMELDNVREKYIGFVQELE